MIGVLTLSRRAHCSLRRALSLFFLFFFAQRALSDLLSVRTFAVHLQHRVTAGSGSTFSAVRHVFHSAFKSTGFTHSISSPCPRFHSSWCATTTRTPTRCHHCTNRSYNSNVCHAFSLTLLGYEVHRLFPDLLDQ